MLRQQAQPPLWLSICSLCPHLAATICRVHTDPDQINILYALGLYHNAIPPNVFHLAQQLLGSYNSFPELPLMKLTFHGWQDHFSGRTGCPLLNETLKKKMFPVKVERSFHP